MNEEIRTNRGGWADISINTVYGIRTTYARVIGEWFAVHRRNGDPESTDWSVTHLKTGHRMPWEFGTCQLAQQFASALRALCDQRGVDLVTSDMSQAGELLKPHKQIYTIAASLGGIKAPTP